MHPNPLRRVFFAVFNYRERDCNVSHPVTETSKARTQGINQPGTDEPQTILRLPVVKSRTGLGRTSIYNLVAAGKFPRHIKISERASGWLAS